MASIEKDPISGQNTTGHVWDGIQELNTPLPRWWVYVFWATIVWAVGYWIVYPSWPFPLGTHTKGVIGYSSRAELTDDMKALAASRAKFTSQMEGKTVQDVIANRELYSFAVAGGRALFAENCQPCHGASGAGAYSFPTLSDDEWLWGGDMDNIVQTISYGIRSDHSQTRQSVMPAFGADALLTPEQVANVAAYVEGLGKGAPGNLAGEQVYAEQCAVCHGEKGEGNADLGAPALNNPIWLYKGTKEAIAEQVNAPKHGVMPAFAGRFDENQIKQLAVYIYSLGGAKK